jgi:hypothetical protein
MGPMAILYVIGKYFSMRTLFHVGIMPVNRSSSPYLILDIPFGLFVALPYTENDLEFTQLWEYTDSILSEDIVVIFFFRKLILNLVIAYPIST